MQGVMDFNGFKGFNESIDAQFKQNHDSLCCRWLKVTNTGKIIEITF